MAKDKPRTKEIKRTNQESPSVKTIMLSDRPSSEAVPGQFAMLWVPDFGEVPIAISGTQGDLVEFTVKSRGKTTEKIHRLEVGENIGVRGPYGVGFSPPTGKSLLVGGGYGVAPLRYLYRKYSDSSQLITMIGAETSEELIFTDELNPQVIATDDGSVGHRGYITEQLDEVLDKEVPEMVYAAGPEMMIATIFEECKEKGVDLEASLERIMKCGVGLCGSCLIDGFRVCSDGPVVGLDQLNKFSEFGRWKRTASGKKEGV